MKHKIEEAVQYFQDGFNCAQALVGSYCEEFGLDKATAFRAATGFGGGMRMGGVCGAVTGAIMVVGLKYGNSRAEDQEVKAKTYERVKEITKRFAARNGSVVCKELLDCDISTPEGFARAQEEGLFESVCPKMVRQAAEVLEEVLAEEG